MRVILDTNVLLGALISPHGPPDAIYRAWRAGGFDLAVRHGEDSGADAFGVVGADVQRQGNRSAGEIGELNALRQDRGNDQPDEQDLQEQRRAANQPDIEIAEPFQRPKLRELAHAAENAEDDAGGTGDQRQPDRDAGAFGELLGCRADRRGG